jgi:hypothetical protein
MNIGYANVYYKEPDYFTSALPMEDWSLQCSRRVADAFLTNVSRMGDLKRYEIILLRYL